ncbi:MULTISPECIES: fatty-acid--CoA ligase FadD1 [unclassified Mycobacterium]|uniref:fatty-acid--CoA ligase FadD1 n=1 Tax=unclassified Mycobacterium TaxID=2642494 RepID=UPI00080153FA|nr:MULTISPECIES: fatty-acid--CoA ligase FadD1 [unclassified Mycobacterium]OBI18977.1 acyl-CoA synthetase [Mycobacterium sp. E2497]
MIETVQQLLRQRRDDDTPALAHGERVWTWREHLTEAEAEAAALIGLADPARPLHVGALLPNSPAMLRAMAAAALGGYVLCGINTTRRGDGLLADIRRSDCQLLLVDPEHRELLDGVDLSGVEVLDVTGRRYAELVAAAPALVPHREVAGGDTLMMIFTSGTSGDPKVVRLAHAMAIMCGASLIFQYDVTAADVCYLSMPLFHSNGVAAGWAVAIGAGATMVPARFSPSRFLDDVRRYGVTYLNYVGKPLALILSTPELPDDADNTLRVAFGNEATDRDIAEFARRFGCRVVDSFGSSEFAVIVVREDGTPPGSIGKPYPGVGIYNPATVRECAVAEFDEHGALTNFDDAVGELVNTQGAGPFAGYYNDPAATAERMRHGMYWSGDLAYRDADGWIYLAGRTADWMRVDGENLAAGPIERILGRLPEISQAAVYAVPDDRVGDQVMAALVVRAGARLGPDDFANFLAAQPDLSPKAWPRYVRINEDLPTTATNKVLKRALMAAGVTAEGGVLWTRPQRGTTYSQLTGSPA